MKKYTKLFNQVVMEYEGEIIFAKTNDTRSFCYPSYNLICMYEEMYEDADIEDLFDLLHEIGHIKANKQGMLRWEEEASATQWAIDKCKELRVKIPKRIREDFDSYIFDWIDYAMSHHSKRLPEFGDNTLVWE